MSGEVVTRPASDPALQQQVNDQFPELTDVAHLLDTRWRIPGTGIRFGVDAVAGLLPGVGDAATGLVSAYIIFKGSQLGASKGTLARMIGNTVLDTTVGSVPLLGSVFDLFFKANNRNVRLLRKHLEDRGKAVPR
jgi:hypothetical protein